MLGANDHGAQQQRSESDGSAARAIDLTTHGLYLGKMPDLASRRCEVLRLLDRYLVEIVEEFGLCPWAHQARLGGAIGIDVVWGTPTLAQWLACSNALLGRQEVQIAMIVAPELACTPAEFRVLRDAAAAQLGRVGIADFHPDAQLDLATPSRLIPYLRRSPDPMLQLVPLSVLEAVRGCANPTAERPAQAQMLVGAAPLPKPDPGEHVAANNYARAVRQLMPSQHSGDGDESAARYRGIDAITAALSDIRADRDRTYAMWQR